LEPLAARGQPALDVVALAREEQQHRELRPEDGHARILEVAVAVVDQLGEIGHDPRPVAADRGHREPASRHAFLRRPTIRVAAAAAPKPLSPSPTTTRAAQVFSMPRRAARPPKLAP